MAAALPLKIGFARLKPVSVTGSVPSALQSRGDLER
jgi:hypothetical protein